MKKRRSSSERMSSASSASTSRLSALALPFNLKNHGAQTNFLKQECNTSAARVFTTGVSSTLSLNPVLPKDLDSCGDAAIINENHLGSHSSAMMGPHALQNSNNKVVLQVKVPTNKGTEDNNLQVINEAINPSINETSELLSSSQNIVDDVSLEAPGAKLGIHLQNTSAMSDQDDSDVDSPCWKGIGFSQSTVQVSEPLTSQPQTEKVSRKSLNPLAPHFIPGSARQLVEHHENEYDGSDSFCFQQTTSSVVYLSSTDNISTAYVKTGTHPSEVSNVIGTRYSSDIQDAGKLYVPPNESAKISLLDYLPGGQLQPIEDHLTCNCQDVMGPNVAGPVKSNKDAKNRGSTHVPFTVTRNASTPSCSRDVVSSDFNNTVRDASKSTRPKIDVQLLINAMHDLSELLMSNPLDSINEDEHDMIQRIINNLYACITNVGQRVSKPESDNPRTSYSPRKLLDCHKEFQVTRMKAISIPHDWRREKSCCSMFSKQVLSSCPRKDGSIKKGDDFTQIIGKAMKVTHPINKETHHRAFSGKLCLDAEVAPNL